MIHLNNKNVSDSKFEMHLLCMAFHKFGVMILKVFLFLYQKVAEYWIFGHKMAKIQNFQINTPRPPIVLISNVQKPTYF